MRYSFDLSSFSLLTTGEAGGLLALGNWYIELMLKS